MLEQAPDGHAFNLIEISNGQGMSATLMDWGATLLSLRVPLSDGSVRETLLGCATPGDYLRQSAYLGASVGRYANRISQGRFTYQGREIAVTLNQDSSHLHGGLEGFDKRRWRLVQHSACEALYALTSLDGDQGYPGTLEVTARYTLSEDNRLTICYQATVDSPCPVNLTNHAYFNLDATPGDIRQHQLQIAADRYLPVGSNGLPQGELKSVAGTSFDFRQPKSIGQDFLADTDQQLVKGYDHAFLLDAQGDDAIPAAKLWSQDARLSMTVFTTAPALQIYTGNYLDNTPAREGGSYRNHHGIALESEFLPDSPNHPEWPQPSCWLLPGQTYRSLTAYQFSHADSQHESQ